MEFKIKTSITATEAAALELAISEVDPAALAAVDAAGTVLMVSTVIGDEALLAMLNQAGHVVSMEQLERVPSVCCGGCGG